MGICAKASEKKLEPPWLKRVIEPNVLLHVATQFTVCTTHLHTDGKQTRNCKRSHTSARVSHISASIDNVSSALEIRRWKGAQTFEERLRYQYYILLQRRLQRPATSSAIDEERKNRPCSREWWRSYVKVCRNRACLLTCNSLFLRLRFHVGHAKSGRIRDERFSSRARRSTKYVQFQKRRTIGPKRKLSRDRNRGAVPHARLLRYEGLRSRARSEAHVLSLQSRGSR